MSSIGFLLIVLVVSVIGCTILWWRHRSPNTLESGIDAWHREMEALAPPEDPTNPPHNGSS